LGHLIESAGGILDDVEADWGAGSAAAAAAVDEGTAALSFLGSKGCVRRMFSGLRSV
jgi:hypothetical protein